jgi:hypothetical protein
MPHVLDQGIVAARSVVVGSDAIERDLRVMQALPVNFRRSYWQVTVWFNDDCSLCRSGMTIAH